MCVAKQFLVVHFQCTIPALLPLAVSPGHRMAAAFCDGSVYFSPRFMCQEECYNCTHFAVKLDPGTDDQCTVGVRTIGFRSLGKVLECYNPQAAPVPEPQRRYL